MEGDRGVSHQISNLITKKLKCIKKKKREREIICDSRIKQTQKETQEGLGIQTSVDATQHFEKSEVI